VGGERARAGRAEALRAGRPRYGCGRKGAIPVRERPIDTGGTPYEAGRPGWIPRADFFEAREGDATFTGIGRAQAAREASRAVMKRRLVGFQSVIVARRKSWPGTATAVPRGWAQTGGKWGRSVTVTGRRRKNCAIRAMGTTSHGGRGQAGHGGFHDSTVAGKVEAAAVFRWLGARSYEGGEPKETKKNKMREIPVVMTVSGPWSAHWGPEGPETCRTDEILEWASGGHRARGYEGGCGAQLCADEDPDRISREKEDGGDVRIFRRRS